MTFRLYPSPQEEAILLGWLELHRQIYNAALEERMDAWRKKRIHISYFNQQNALPALKKDLPELHVLGSHALQETLRRLDRAFQAFYRRCAKGQTPGFPRFKGKKRFDSFCFPDPAGWSITSRGYEEKDGSKGAKYKNKRSHTLRVGALSIQARGMCRFDAYVPNDLTIKRLAEGVWEACVTLRVDKKDCKRERAGNLIRGFDQGLEDRMVFDDGEEIANPRWLREELDNLALLQQSRARCQKRSCRHKKLNRQIARLHRAIANKRKDWLHKLSTELVASCEIICTEELTVRNMSRAPTPKPELDEQGKETGRYLPNGAAAKAGLNRELLSAGLGMLLRIGESKAAEAGTLWHVAKTRQIKPTQRCACCGTIIKKHLDERMHICLSCGFITTRDRNAALVCLVDGLCPGYWAAIDKKKPASMGSYGVLIKNRILYAAQTVATDSGTAHGTGVVTEIVKSDLCDSLETPA